MSIIPPNNLPIYLQQYTVECTRPKTNLLFSTMALIPSNIQTERVFQLTIAAVLQRPVVLGEPTQSVGFVIDYSNIDNHDYLITLEGDVLGTVTESGASASLFPNSVFTLDTVNKVLYLDLQWDGTWVLEDCPSKTFLFTITINDSSSGDCTYNSTSTYLKCNVDLAFDLSNGYQTDQIGTLEYTTSSKPSKVYIFDLPNGWDLITWHIGSNSESVNQPTVYFQYGAVNDSTTYLGNQTKAGQTICKIQLYNDSSKSQKIGFYNSAGKIVPCCGGISTNGCTALQTGPSRSMPTRQN